MARSRPLDGEFRYRHPIEIRYNDTDALGHVNNAVYFSVFRDGPRRLLPRSWPATPSAPGPTRSERTFVIAEAHISYRQPAFYGEPLVGAVRVGWVSRSAFGFEYRLEVEASALGDARVVADGSTVQVFYDLERGRPMRTPADLVADLEAYEGHALPPRPTG